MNTILISIIAIPIIEILLFIKIGENIGAINTILLIILTAVVGVYFARIQGIRTIKSGFLNIYQNKLPVYEILSGASLNRFVTHDDLAEQAHFLCSPLGKNISGQAISVCGNIEKAG